MRYPYFCAGFVDKRDQGGNFAYILYAMEKTRHKSTSIFVKQDTANRNVLHSPHEHSFAHPHRTIATLGVDEGMKVADFGAGSGAYALLFAHAVGMSGRVYAVDVQRDLLRRIHNEAHRKGLDNVDVIWGDLETPHGSKLADRSIDIVLISNLLFQIGDIHAIFDEAWRILKPTGRLVVIEWRERPTSARVAGVAPIGPHRDSLVGRAHTIADAHARGFKLSQ